MVVERISELIKEKGITEKTFLQDLGLSKNALSEWRSGVTKSYMAKIDLIADYFGVTTDYLLGRSDQRYPQESLALSSDIPYEELPPEAVKQIFDYIAFIKEQYKKNK